MSSQVLAVRVHLQNNFACNEQFVLERLVRIKLAVAEGHGGMTRQVKKVHELHVFVHDKDHALDVELHEIFAELVSIGQSFLGHLSETRVVTPCEPK